MEKPQQYVGISGGVEAAQQESVRALAGRLGVKELGAFVMWGIQAGTKTQVLGVPTRYGERWHTVGDNIKNSAFVDESGLTRPYIHIYGGDDDMSLQLTTIEATADRTAGFHQGVQLNRMDWHLPGYDTLLVEARDIVGDVPIVLQCHERVLGSLSPEELVRRLGQLKPEYVLFDMSHGKGEAMEPANFTEYIEAIYQANLPTSVVVAGGLCAETLLELMGLLYNRHTDLSCDAEGRLRKGEKGATELDMTKVEKYLTQWTQLTQSMRTAD